MSARTAHRGFLLSLACLLTAWPPDASAQTARQDPHLAYAFPAGGQQGTTVDIVVGGQFLQEATEAYLAGKDVKVEVLKWYRPLTRGEYNNLRMKLDEARMALVEERKTGNQRGAPTSEQVAAAAGVTAEQLREMEIFRQRDQDPKRQPNEQLQEEVSLRLTIGKNAPPGKRELRLLTETAMSNPIWIQVGKWPEVRETEPNDQQPDPAIGQMPVVVNGQVMPGDTDTFSFTARKGMRLVIEAAARDVIPYLADAVPGWFQAVLTLRDSAGNEVAFADSFHYRQDPVIYFEVPRDDRYTLAIHDSLYRGREDFVYRLTLGELPFVTSVFPLGAQIDSDVQVQLQGWNLSQHTLDVKTMSRRAYRPVRWYSVPQADSTAVRFPLQIDYLREVFDQEPNNDAASSQEVTTRMIINGRIDQPGDQDVFRIAGGGRLVAEVQARRHGSPLDSLLSLTDAEGREVAFNDDHEDKSQSLLTHHADSRLEAVLPGAGPYYLQVSDAQRKGGPDFIYRLYLRAPQPDYELRVVPSSIIARAGAVVPITVFALRNDGFAEDIELSLVEPPPGFQLAGGVIPGQADHARLTLTVPPTAPGAPLVLEMEGKARRGSGSRSVLTRPAVPAENMMQAFIWYHLVPVEEWSVIVSGKPGARPPFDLLLPPGRVKLPTGGDYLLSVRPHSDKVTASELRVVLDNPPKGISAAIVTDELGRFAVKLTIDQDEVQPGLQGNLLLHVHRETTPPATEDNPNPRARRTDLGFLPAVPFAVAERRATR